MSMSHVFSISLFAGIFRQKEEKKKASIVCHIICEKKGHCSTNDKHCSDKAQLKETAANITSANGLLIQKGSFPQPARGGGGDGNRECNPYFFSIDRFHPYSGQLFGDIQFTKERVTSLDFHA
ncbi:hypothetical protein CEXT_455911 [Caerostris extrusa]|uniref:Uncharacterized protein n=1 Tax=Caerostris extrusa TaxID=172846 RepID=A0AAV4RJJ5_CAEEX|nr:hypothetical protein CEXT_455911 [Caerostris extrusa]